MIRHRAALIRIIKSLGNLQRRRRSSRTKDGPRAPPKLTTRGGRRRPGRVWTALYGLFSEKGLRRARRTAMSQAVSFARGRVIFN
ncbi:hypothetical protein EVAR_57096_1 [Eumeta japonica]|uniref:Uncharacterized protein n=1 Tax=Eumeta variegata TaxID=151549 RepID=A0A4C1Z528_EUMVA|nr:hypothetical protein EVAR_57096_1 [Eumeta japonica]